MIRIPLLNDYRVTVKRYLIGILLVLLTASLMAALCGCSAQDANQLNEDIYLKNLYVWNGSAWVKLPGSGAGDMTKAVYDPANIGEQLVGVAAAQELDSKTLDSSIGKGTWTASGTWTLPAHTAGGDITLAESVSIVLDASLSADGKWSGIVESGVAGDTLSFGDLVYLSSVDGRWELADADAEAMTKPKLGICMLAAAGNGSSTTILLYGKVRADTAFPSLTVGAPVYISTTAGDITNTAPSGSGDCVRIVGFGNTADELAFQPDNTWLELN